MRLLVLYLSVLCTLYVPVHAITRSYLIFIINLKLPKIARIPLKLPRVTKNTVHLLCSSGNWRVGKYLRNAGSVGWE
jgi:hypothetical protein